MEKKETYHPGKDKLIVIDNGESRIKVEDFTCTILTKVEKP